MKFMVALILACLIASCLTVAAEEFAVQVLPAEHKKMADPATGAQLTFLTTNPAKDTNLYFHERSWLADGSVILFNSARENGGLMGYVVATGELLRLTTPSGGLGGATAAITGCGFYALRGRETLQLTLNLDISPNPEDSPSTAVLIERVICHLPEGAGGTGLNESCDGKHLSIGLSGGKAGAEPAIYIIDIAGGTVNELCRPPDPPGYAYHVQWSHTNPNLISYAALVQRLMVVDIREGVPRNVYKAWPGELVTHESWWVNDQILFCGGVHPFPTEDAHVKVLNITTGEVCIIGAGAWWPEATPEQLARHNWWHSDGSDDGRWVVADNWHGDIMLFEAKTTRPRLLTGNHRTYGIGDHPHVGFDRTSKAVVFTSHLLGDENVCIAEIPATWQKENE